MQLKRKFDAGEFAVLAEMEPPKGVDVSTMVTHAKRVKGDVDAFVVPEMSNAVMRMSSLGGAVILQNKGMETVIQLNCRDRNRIALQACLRAGVAISPAGGALGQMLLPFKMGVGGRLGSGRQYFSWIDVDDLVALIVHVIYDESMRGPVNATAPNAVTNATFTDVLGRVLGRPTLIPVPAFAVKAVFGQLGEEALLWGQRVIPQKVLRSGFSFDCEGIEDSLRFQLGRNE